MALFDRHVTQKLACIYCRVSTADQRDHGFSLPSQLERCLKYAEAHDYDVPEAYIFQEDFTGTSLRRPKLSLLRDLVRLRSVQAVICYDNDRLSRKLAHGLLLQEEFDQAGVALHVVTSPPQDKSPEGQLLANVCGVIAEYEREKLVERTRRGREARAKAGHVPPGRHVYGYRYLRDRKGAHYERDDDEASVVQRVYALYVSGMSQESIAKQLTAEGIPSPKAQYRRLAARVWHQSAIRRILSEEAYVGTLFDGKRRNAYIETDQGRRVRHVPLPREEWVPIPTPELIDRETWDKAQALRVQNKLHSPRNTKHVYLLPHGRLRCGICGHSMTPSTNHKGEIRYACETSKRPYSPPHTRKSVAGEVVEDEVWRAIESALDNPQRVLQELLRQQEDAERQHTHIDRDKESYERQLARYEQESQRLLDVYLAGAVSIETFKTRNSELELRQARIREEIAALDATAQAIQHGALTLETVRNYFAQALERLTTMSAEDKSLTAESLDVRAIWTPGAPLEIAGAINLWVTSGTPQCSAHEPSYRHSCQARESSAYDH